MLVYPSGNGMLIDDGTRIAIDVSRRYKGAVHIVTHAHYDHLGAVRKGPGFSNFETSKILETRGIYVEPVEGLEVGNYRVSFLNAGHIVGSTQVLLENGKSILVTGDFKAEDDMVVRGADTENVDILFIDTTFGVPYFKFPSRRTLYRHLKSFVYSHKSKDESTVLFAYSVGKAQELTALLNTWGIKPYVLPETHIVNSLFGLRDNILRSVPTQPSVLILPPRFKKILAALSFQTGITHRGIFVSGWNPTLPLSSHADWFQTVEFIEDVSPEIVITYGNNAERSARYLKMEGFEAIPLIKPLFI